MDLCYTVLVALASTLVLFGTCAVVSFIFSICCWLSATLLICPFLHAMSGAPSLLDQIAVGVGKICL